MDELLVERHLEEKRGHLSTSRLKYMSLHGVLFFVSLHEVLFTKSMFYILGAFLDTLVLNVYLTNASFEIEEAALIRS